MLLFDLLLRTRQAAYTHVMLGIIAYVKLLYKQKDLRPVLANIDANVLDFYIIHVLTAICFVCE